MGLDMYLSASRYVSATNWQEVNKAMQQQKEIDFNNYRSDEYLKLVELFPTAFTKFSETGGTVSINVGQWRKANQIHGWFVRHVQGGVDDCKEYSVSREHLVELLYTVNKVLAGDKDTAKELLPVTAGFFFGNYDEEGGYDEWYYEDLKRTKDILENILAVVPEGNYDYDFVYQSSW
jgi:hypothetical protein